MTERMQSIDSDCAIRSLGFVAASEGPQTESKTNLKKPPKAPPLQPLKPFPAPKAPLLPASLDAWVAETFATIERMQTRKLDHEKTVEQAIETIRKNAAAAGAIETEINSIYAALRAVAQEEPSSTNPGPQPATNIPPPPAAPRPNVPCRRHVHPTNTPAASAAAATAPTRVHPSKPKARTQPRPSRSGKTRNRPTSTTLRDDLEAVKAARPGAKEILWLVATAFIAVGIGYALWLSVQPDPAQEISELWQRGH